jgi:hypothetical protein
MAGSAGLAKQYSARSLIYASRGNVSFQPVSEARCEMLSAAIYLTLTFDLKRMPKVHLWSTRL